MIDPITYPLSLNTFMSTVEYLTDITPVGNQREYRIARADDGLVYFNAVHGVRSLKDLHALMSFHRRRKGKARGFLVRDLLDYQHSWDGSLAPIGLGTNDVNTVFQLSKTYSDLYNSEVRTITKAQHATIKIYVDSSLKVEGTDYSFTNGYQGKNDAGANYRCTVDGQFKFLAGHVPALNAVIEAEFNFYVPVRFMEDKLPADQIAALLKPDPNDSTQWIMDTNNVAGQLPAVMMREVKEI